MFSKGVKPTQVIAPIKSEKDKIVLIESEQYIRFKCTFF